MIGELFAHVFAAYKGIRELGDMLVRGTTVILLLCIVIVAYTWARFRDPIISFPIFSLWNAVLRLCKLGCFFFFLGLFCLGLCLETSLVGIARALLSPLVYLVTFHTYDLSSGSSNQSAFLVISKAPDIDFAWQFG